MSEATTTARVLPISEAAFKLLTDAMPQMVWSTRPDGHHDYYNARWYEFTGVPQGSTDGDGWAGMFHPDDQPQAWEKWRHSLSTGEPYEVEYRLRHHSGDYRWTIGRAQPVRDGDGQIVRWIGTCTDIHVAKLTAEQNELLSHELSHRIKNIFAVIGGLIGLTARHYPEAKAFAAAVRQRVSALGRAHEFVRPHSEDSRPTIERTTLRGLLADMFKAYPATDEGRITIAGDDPSIDDRGATPIALLFHELVTNAIKYGALSVAEGRIDIAITQTATETCLTWRETGGPAVLGAPDKAGFGTRLAELSIVRQLDGTLERDWRPEGLVVVARVRPSQLTRDPN